MDYSNIQNNILLDYIQNEGPSEEEIDAFHLGMIRFQNAIDSGEWQNSDIPFTQSEVIRLERKNAELKEIIQNLEKKNSNLKSEITKITKLTPSERTKLKHELEYKRLNKELANIQVKLQYEKGRSELWLTRYSCLKLEVNSGPQL